MEQFGGLVHVFPRFRLSLLLLLAACMGGCATNPGIVKTGSDIYTLYKADHGGIFGNGDLLRTDVINQANVFAESQGKIANPVSAKTHPMGWCCGDWATFEYQFRLVDKNDHTVRRTHLVPGSDVVADDTGKISVDVMTESHHPDIPKDKDVYAELYKLDDLRKKGIINESEFETQKKKLLNGTR